MSNFLKLIRELTGGELTRYHRDRLTSEIISVIDDNYSVMERYLESIIDNVIRSECRRQGYFYDSLKINIDSLLYHDGSKKRVTLFVAIIQDYRVKNDDLEENIFNSIMSFIRSKNLDVLINDVNVNKKQWRRDRKISKLYKETSNEKTLEKE